mmetsp:Transcript_17833/g.60827  ORF Transcript_17833/g.60827 Transcript_17833/m.60827 type:complete len:97 (-) Transcript_17833:816-1106(-)
MGISYQNMVGELMLGGVGTHSKVNEVIHIIASSSQLIATTYQCMTAKQMAGCEATGAPLLPAATNVLTTFSILFPRIKHLVSLLGSQNPRHDLQAT